MKIEVKKIKILKKLPWLAKRHAFGTLMILFLIVFGLGFFITYKYVFLAEKEEVVETKLKGLHQEEYNEVLEKWEARSQKFEEASLKEYPDIFRGY